MFRLSLSKVCPGFFPEDLWCPTSPVSLIFHGRGVGSVTRLSSNIVRNRGHSPRGESTDLLNVDMSVSSRLVPTWFLFLCFYSVRRNIYSNVFENL